MLNVSLWHAILVLGMWVGDAHSDEAGSDRSTIVTAGAGHAQGTSESPIGREEGAVIVIQSYAGGLAAIRSANPEVKLSVGREAAVRDGPILLVDYPAATGNPGGRDVWCDAEHTDWRAGGAISFQAKPDQALRISVSFLDHNRVAYTTWADLKAAVWQTVHISFDEIRPNPYFQPPGVDTSAPLDVSEVTRLGFAPQGPSAGRLAVSRIVVVD